MLNPTAKSGNLQINEELTAIEPLCRGCGY